MIATYRLQLEPKFGFAEVVQIVPYLQRLGISHLYLSPITEAKEGSTHGYDVIDHNAIRDQLGGEKGWHILLATVRDAGLKIIIDIVPNHAGVGPHNEAWQNVLAFGKHSKFAEYFDIDWSPLEDSLHDKVLLPFLGKPYGQCLDDGEISIVKYGSTFRASYGEHNFALSPVSYACLLAAAMPLHERSDLYFDIKDLQEGYRSLTPEDVPRAEMLERRLDQIADQVNWEATLATFTGTALHELLEQQNWRLAYWKAASYEINYRRFFDVNGLFALRVQDDEVFWSSHTLVSELLAVDVVDGLRVDHVDGLFDPQAYLQRLHDLGARHVWVEKILAAGETLPDEWRVEGTTGYEFMNDAMNVLADAVGLESIIRTYHRFVQDNDSYEKITRESKHLVMEYSLSSELHRLAYGLNRLCKADYHTRDFALGALREALVELIAAIGRYRTYLPYGFEAAEKVVQTAVQLAIQRTPSFEPTIYSFIAKVILGDLPEQLLESQQAWVGRFQQYCSAVAAKGVEDTTFYRYVPLIALNEVGGEPLVGEQPLQAFHSHARFRARYRPLSLLATATHDHKRGEDTRMRLIALTEFPDLWDETLRSLAKIGEAHSSLHTPSRHDQYLLFQVLLATWFGHEPSDYFDRLWTYMQKAARESKQKTSWNNPNEHYEKALKSFVSNLLSHEELPAAIAPLAQKIAQVGLRNSISQLVLKFTTPGVPDIYQGCELLDLSLVDPDNRRPVDYSLRTQFLHDCLTGCEAKQKLNFEQQIESIDESIKMFFLARLLHLRTAHTELFKSGSYQELKVNGPDSNHWIAFSRQLDNEVIAVIVPRLNSVQRMDAHIELDARLHGQNWTELLSQIGHRFSETVDVALLPQPWAVLYWRADGK